MNRLAPKYKEDFIKQIYISSPKIRHPQICCFLEPIFVHSEFAEQRQLGMLMSALHIGVKPFENAFYSKNMVHPKLTTNTFI